MGCAANVICLVEVTVKAAVVESYVKVKDVTGLKESLVWDAVADYLVDGCAEGFGEVNIVEGRGIRL